MSPEAKGQEAARILANEVFLEAEAIAEADAIKRWKIERDREKRDAIWMEVQALRATRVALEILVGRGQTAAHQAQKEARLNA